MTIPEFLASHITPHHEIIADIAPIMAHQLGGAAWTHTGTSRRIPEVSLSKLAKGYEWETAAVVSNVEMTEALDAAGYEIEAIDSDVAIYALWTKKPASIVLEIISL